MDDDSSGKRPKYPQNWSAYNDAQKHEKDRVLELLAALCESIEEIQQICGRKRIPRRAAIFGAVATIYTTLSVRRAESDVRASAARGLICRAPSYGSTFRTLGNSATTEILLRLIEESAAPLAQIESKAGQFAADSTGISTVVYQRWLEHRGKSIDKKLWVKLHVMVGTLTNVVTAVKVTSSHGKGTGDCPILPELLKSTAKRFDVKELSADMAYLSKKNLRVIEEVGAIPYIPFKTNSIGMASKSRAWQKMYYRFAIEDETFFAHYHRRSNVESTMSAIKRKLGAAIRARGVVAQTNEILAKVLLYNLTCLVHAMVEFTIVVDFAKPKDSTEVT